MTARTSRTIICVKCGYKNIVANEQSAMPKICTQCGQFITQAKCIRCGHTWNLKSATIPKTCPNRKCASPYWCRERTNKRATK